mgnify:CR=1 FL=1
MSPARGCASGRRGRSTAGRQGCGSARKADIDARTRLITSIYLPEEEFAVLAAYAAGLRITSCATGCNRQPESCCRSTASRGARGPRHAVEAEFDTLDLMAAFPAPDFAGREVTDDQLTTAAAISPSTGCHESMDQMTAWPPRRCLPLPGRARGAVPCSRRTMQAVTVISVIHWLGASVRCSVPASRRCDTDSEHHLSREVHRRHQAGDGIDGNAGRPDPGPADPVGQPLSRDRRDRIPADPGQHRSSRRVPAGLWPGRARIREHIRHVAARSFQARWPDEDFGPTGPMPDAARNQFTDVRRQIVELEPADAAQRWFQSQALQITNRLSDLRWLVMNQANDDRAPVACVRPDLPVQHPRSSAASVFMSDPTPRSSP